MYNKNSSEKWNKSLQNASQYLLVWLLVRRALYGPETVDLCFGLSPSFSDSTPHTVASLNVIVRTAECRLGEGMALDALG